MDEGCTRQEKTISEVSQTVVPVPMPGGVPYEVGR
jgi:hypothetical protein